MNDLELTLQEYVATANDPKANGNWDLINSKFPELADFDPVLLQEYVKTANDPKANGDYDVINSKFPEFSSYTDSKSEDGSLESPDVEEGSWKTDENLTEEEIVKRDNDFIAAWKEINPDSEITNEDLVKEKKKEEAKKNVEPTPEIDTSNSLLAPYLKSEDELIAQPSTTFIQQQVVLSEEEDKKILEINEVNKKASTNFDNYKKKNPNLFKSVYTDQGLTTVAKYEDKEVVDKINKDLTFDYIRNNKEIQDLIIPNIYKDNQSVINARIQELKQKYGDGEDFNSQEDYDKAQSELNVFVSNFITDNTRYKEIVTDYSNSINELHLKDNNAFTVDKHTPDFIQSLQAAHDANSLSPISPISLYNTVRSIGTGLETQLFKVQEKYDWSQRHERLQKNLQREVQENWTDEKTGFINKQGDFKPLAAKRDDYRTPSTWGEAKKKMQSILVDNETKAKEDLMDIMDKRAIEGAYEKADFIKFASG